ncbi:hypothetical protein FSP39_021654 [Pinctada imbricata]|uniref:ADP/ATP translocase n=1 Tax=Pinctada imbricata TaxID=66713 RepID=A0AA89BPT1_PINIB|nr:hypothetical protein FSP39_021654 [Pinctada imbricata]
MPHPPDHPHYPTISEIYLINSLRNVVHRTSVAPIERVQLLLQCEGEMKKSGRLNPGYRGIVDCVSRTYRSEGAISFFRGNLTSCLPVFLTFPSSLITDRFLRQYLIPPQESSRTFKIVSNFGLAFLVGTLNIGLVYHFDFVRTRLANDVVEIKDGQKFRQYSGTLDVYRKTIKSDGFRGLYRGYIVCCIGNALHAGVSLSFVEFRRVFGSEMQARQYMPYLLGASIVTSFAAAVMTYPFDTVRRRMMMRSGEPVKYGGGLECVSRICRREGARALWRGFLVNIIKTISGIAVFYAIDLNM